MHACSVIYYIDNVSVIDQAVSLIDQVDRQDTEHSLSQRDE